MKKNLLILGLIFSVAINAAVLIKIGHHWLGKEKEGRYHREGKHSSMSYLHKELSLSEKQTGQMNALKERFRSNARPVRAVLRTKRKQLVQLLMASEPDRSKIDAVISEINLLQGELQKRVVDHLLAQKEILTAEQQQKFLFIIRDRLMEEESHHETNRLSIMGEK